MTRPLTDLLRERLAFDDDACRDTAKHEDSDGYFGFISGSQWENARLAPLHELLIEMSAAVADYMDDIEHVDASNENFERMRTALTRLREGVSR